MNHEPSLLEMINEIVELDLREMLDDPESLREMIVKHYAQKPVSEIRHIYFTLHPEYGENDAARR